MSDRIRHLVDTAAARVLGLPAAGRDRTSRTPRISGTPKSGYTIEPVTTVMRDGVELAGDHYRPTGPAAGTLLIRTPYHRGFPFCLPFARVHAARGYHVVVQNVRGTFGSGGRFEPVVHEADDGADTVAWLCEQPWFTGSFATIGLSYLGLTQWALLRDPPPELAAAVITVGVHDFSFGAWGTGAFALNDLLNWSYLVSHQEDDGQIRSTLTQPFTRRRLLAAAGGLPLGRAGRSVLGSRARWYESWLEHPDIADPFWEPYRFDEALERSRVPTLLIGGWQDLLLTQTMRQYNRLRERGVEVALTVGPWTHTEVVGKGLGIVTRETLGWLDAHLRGDSDRTRRRPVRIFVTEHRSRRARRDDRPAGWHALATWPPPVSAHAWFLRSGGALGGRAPDPGDEVTFRYDPASPTPTVGGRLLDRSGGYRSDTRLAGRDDVVCFTGEPLTDDLWVAGTPIAELDHHADTPYVDVFVRISEVDARGRSRNVSDGYRRRAGSLGPLRIDLDQTAHRFAAGSRIRVLIAGGCYPRFARNPGTGDPPLVAERLRPAIHTIRLGSSRILLPVGAPGLP